MKAVYVKVFLDNTVSIFSVDNVDDIKRGIMLLLRRSMVMILVR